MRKNICEPIRRELDELMLGETGSSVAVQHLRDCSACRDFHEKQTRLRQIVGSLGTVAAPADFDFRLRARLASEASAASHFSFIEWPFVRRSFAVVALLIVLATGAVLVRNVLNRPAAVPETARQLPPPQVLETPKEVVTPNVPAPQQQEVVTLNPSKRPQINRREPRAELAVRNQRPLVAKEFSSPGAEVINGSEPVGMPAAFPIDASSLQSFKVSLDDGRGNAKTISVPTISFGSQRLMQNANQFAPKRVW